MGTHRLATRSNEFIMKFFAVASALFVAASAEAQLPIASPFLPTAGLYAAGGYGYAAPYAAAYAAPVAATAVDAKFAYGAPVTALNAGPLTAGPVAAAPAIAAPIATATYAAAPAIAAPVATAPYAAAPVATTTYAAAAPAIAAAPVAAPASSQYQAQDEFGNIAYGYQNINSAKQESGNALGGVTGSYTYADEAGVHTVNYVADALGFRVAGDNLPVAPIHAAVAPVNTLAPVVDTPEVVEAKAAFFQAYDAAKAGIVKRSAQIAVPATYAAAPAREAVLTTIKLNPGHATFYRVD